MKISIPFLATDIMQLPAEGTSNAVEAVIFNFADLQDENWKIAWENISKAIKKYQAHNVTFHFPVNDSDYCANPFVESRLSESYSRASDLGMHGVVVHSNRIRKIPEWQNVNLKDEREIVASKLAKIVNSKNSNTFLALENMPIMDNYAIEIDPLFCFPEDFSVLNGTGVGVVWDICHYSITRTNITEVLEYKQNKSYYPNFRISALEDFNKIKDQIVHWHFAAFDGVANPDTGSHTKEGVIPSESFLGEGEYEKYLKEIFKICNTNQHIVFEIQDNNYSERVKVYQMINWYKGAVAQ